MKKVLTLCSTLVLLFACTFTLYACNQGHKHVWGAFGNNTATCTEDGIETRLCRKDNSHSETRPTEKLGHDWSAWGNNTATCMAEGTETRICLRDGSHTETQPTPKLAHTYDQGVVTTPATATEPGEMTYSCTFPDCDHTKTEVIPAHEHSVSSDWTSDAMGHWHACEGCVEKDSYATHTAGEWIVDIEATETTTGSQHKECTVCEHITEIQTIPVIHVHEYLGNWSKNTTHHWHDCDSCDEKDSYDAHIAGEWIIDLKATTTTTGSKHRECTVCEYVMETQTIPVIVVETELSNFLSAISDIQGNFTIEAIINFCLCSYQVNGNVSLDYTYYSSSSEAWGYFLIKDDVTYYGYSYDNATLEEGFNVNKEFPINALYYYEFYSVFMNNLVSDTDFIFIEGVYTLDLESVSLPVGGYTLTALSIEFKDDDGEYVEVIQTMNSSSHGENIFTFKITFGNSELTEDDFPPFHIFSGDWSTNTTHHWHDCEYCLGDECTEQGDYATHTAGEWIVDLEATETTTGSKHKECTVCGYTVETEVIDIIVDELDEFLAAISDIYGNFIIDMTDGGFRKVYEVNDNVSACYLYSSSTLISRSYYLIEGGVTYCGASTDNVNWVAGIPVYKTFPGNSISIHDTKEFLVFFNNLVSVTDFIKAGDVYTLDLASVILNSSNTLTALSIEFKAGYIEVIETINGTTYTFTVTLGTATVTEADFEHIV